MPWLRTLHQRLQILELRDGFVVHSNDDIAANRQTMSLHHHGLIIAAQAALIRRAAAFELIYQDPTLISR